MVVEIIKDKHIFIIEKKKPVSSFFYKIIVCHFVSYPGQGGETTCCQSKENSTSNISVSKTVWEKRLS